MKDLKNFQSFEIANVETVEGGWCNCSCGQSSSGKIGGGFSGGGFGGFNFGSLLGSFDFSSLASLGSVGGHVSQGQAGQAGQPGQSVSIQTVHPVQQPVIAQPVFNNFWWCV